MRAWLLVTFQADHFTAWPARHITLSRAAQAPAPA